MNIRPASTQDFDAILALNTELVHFLSPLDRNSLLHLHKQSALHTLIELEGQVVAFILALREGADYNSPNYHWFSSQYKQFLYIDRIVVSPHYQGRGLGRMLYKYVFTFAKQNTVPVITCEYDIEPPNPISQQFHAQLGFSEVGRQQVAGGKKWVSLQAASTL